MSYEQKIVVQQETLLKHLDSVTVQPALFLRAWQEFMFAQAWSDPQPEWVKKCLLKWQFPWTGDFQVLVSQVGGRDWAEGVLLRQKGVEPSLQSPGLIFDLCTQQWELTTPQSFLDLVRIKGRRG